MLTVALSIATTGCATTKTLRQTRIADFESTGSPCLDAVMVNMSAEGCTDIQQEALGTETRMAGKRIHCSTYSDDSDPSSGWLINEFYVIRPHSHLRPPPGLLPLCLDTMAVVLWSERD